MTLAVKDAAGATKDLETGAGDGGITPFRSPVSAAVGKIDDVVATTDTGDFSVIAFIKRALQNWTTLLTRIPGLGQAVPGSSLPVVLPADQITSLAAPVLGAGANAIGSVSVSNFPATQPVSAASLPLPTGASTAANQGTGNTSLASIDTKTPALGQALAAASRPVVLTAIQAASLAAPVPSAGTAGGATTHHLGTSAASTNATSVKASAGTLYSLEAFNTATTDRWLKIYDKASAPTVGTDTPIKTLLIPASVSSLAGGIVRQFNVGVALANGLAYALTTGKADSDTGAVASGDVTLNIDYK